MLSTDRPKFASGKPALCIAHAHCLQFEHSGMVLMSHIREASKVTVNSSYFHPAHQHYTDEAHKVETVPSVVIYRVSQKKRKLLKSPITI